MTSSVEEVLDELRKQGFKCEAVLPERAGRLREDIDKHIRAGLIDKDLADAYLRFEFDAEKALPGARTLFIVAAPEPITRVRFAWKGEVIAVDVPPTYIGAADDARIKETMSHVLDKSGHKIARARLPVKTLAVRSGLAQYGRNNVTYVPGFGSFHRLAAFFADAPLHTDSWHELAVMKACEQCRDCVRVCPTRCIDPDRFLVHAENCLTWHNEREGEFVDWIKPDWHNALVGCMKCQLACPANAKQVAHIAEGPSFSEEETGSILAGTPLDKLPEETRRKLLAISADDWYGTLARNLKVLIGE